MMMMRIFVEIIMELFSPFLFLVFMLFLLCSYIYVHMAFIVYYRCKYCKHFIFCLWTERSLKYETGKNSNRFCFFFSCSSFAWLVSANICALRLYNEENSFFHLNNTWIPLHSYELVRKIKIHNIFVSFSHWIILTEHMNIYLFYGQNIMLYAEEKKIHSRQNRTSNMQYNKINNNTEKKRKKIHMFVYFECCYCCFISKIGHSITDLLTKQNSITQNQFIFYCEKKNVFFVFPPSLFNHFNQFVFYFYMVFYVEETNNQLNSMHVSFSSSLKILGWNQKHAQSKNLFISIENIVIIPFIFSSFI